MLTATTGVRAAGNTGFLFETLFEVAQWEKKEARRIFAMDGLVASVTTDAPNNQTYGLSHLLSAPVTKCFPCIACKNRIDVNDPCR